MDKFIGRTLDNRYHIEEIIGVGGMAVVYRALDSRLNRYVALKILKEEYAIDRDFRRRFHDESQAVAMLSHPNIVNVFDVSRTDNTEYIVMELIDGITLKEYMRKRGAMGWKEITFFAIQIAKALEHAHSRGIIHRDIKPQNIMLLQDGTVKVADFGIARHISKQDTYNMGEAIGSVHYVSPEQAKGSFIDNRADIYSFGVVLYEMITGRLPFEGDTPIAVALQHINSIALPPRDYVPDVPPALEAITLKAMNPSLSRRYLSATEMLADLESYRNDPDFSITIIMDEEEGDGRSLPDDENGKTRRINNTGEVEKLLAAKSGNGKGEKKGVMTQRDKKSAGAAGEKPRKRPDTSFPTSIIFSLLAVLVFFGGAIYFMVKVIDPFSSPTSTKFEVPYLIGQNINEVLATADRWPEFTLAEGEYIYSDTHDAGTIISQTPGAYRKEEKGTIITLEISRGKKSFELEDYTDWDLQYVQADLRLKGLVEGPLIKEYHEDVPANRIISTEPDAGTSMTPGDVVILRISLGRELEEVIVPDLTGMTLEEATAALEAKRLVLGQVYSSEDEAPEGTVIFQTLPGETRVMEGSICDLHISEGMPEEETQPEPDPGSNPGTNSGGSGTVQPPVNPDVNYAGGSYSEPAWYATRTDLVTVDVPFTVIDSDGPVTVLVYLNNGLYYMGTHTTAEGELVLRLRAPAGENQVRIEQNGDKTVDRMVIFS